MARNGPGRGRPRLTLIRNEHLDDDGDDPFDEEDVFDEDELFDDDDEPFDAEEFMEWVARVRAGRATGQREEPVPVPEAGAKAVAWAKKNGLGAQLATNAAIVQPWLSMRLPVEMLEPYTVEELLQPGRATRGRRALLASFPPHMKDVLKGAARKYLAQALVRKKVEEARAIAWAKAPAEPRLAALSDVLREALEVGGEVPPIAVDESAVSVREDPPEAIWSWNRYDSRRTVVDLAGVDAGRISGQCHCHPAEDGLCAHQRLLVEVLLDAIHGGDARLRREIEQAVAMPAWERLMAGLEQAGRRRMVEDEEVRLVWRVGEVRGALVVQPALQQRRANGKWSRGRKLRSDELRLRDVPADPRDRDPIEAYVTREEGRRWGSATIRAAGARLFKSLVDHPRVVTLDPPHRPIRVRRAAVRLTGVMREGHLELVVRVGEEVVPPERIGALSVGEGLGAHLDQARDTLWVFPLERPLLSVAGALSRYPVSVPASAHERAARVLQSLSSELDVELPEALRGEARPADPAPLLRLRPEGDGLFAELRVRPLGEQDFGPGQGPAEVYATMDERRVHARRDREEESSRAAALAARLGLPERSDGAFAWALDAPEAALDVVHAAADLGDELRVEWPADGPRWQARTASPGDLRVRVTRLADWFGVSGALEVDGDVVPLDALLASVRSGRRYVELGPGRFARIAEKLAVEAALIDGVAFSHGKHLAVAPAAVETLEGLEVGEVDCDAEWRALRARMEAARSLEPEVPGGLQAALRSYQVDGFRWLARLSAWDAGCCLADDMGLGKTVQMLAVLLSRKSEGPSLVVAPTSVGAGWMSEAARFAPELRTRLYRGPDRAELLEDLGPGDLLVTSYDILALDAEALAGVALDVLVLDEAQCVKNPRTRRARAARGLTARWRVALTGTPVENHLGELWSIYSIISPGLLGPWEHFKERFAAPIERDGDTRRLEALSRHLRPFLLRRTKGAVAPELPPRTEVVETVELSRAERRIYDAARSEALARLVARPEDGRGRIEILAALTRLRRIACHAKLVDEGYRGSSAKLGAVMALIEDLSRTGQRALVFSQFTSFLSLVREALDARDIGYLYLDGKTPASARARGVERWHAGEADFFLISLKAGGSGLNLTGADAVIHLDPWWNPAVENQATDRTHRIGQTRPVTVIRMIVEETIEEAVLSLHAEKSALARGLLDGADAAGQLSSEELVDLIRFGGELAAGEEDAEETDDVEASSTDVGPGPSLSSEDLDALMDQLEARLKAEARAGEIGEGTVRGYVRAFERVVDFARRRRSPRPLEVWRDEYLAALAAGTIDGPKSAPPFVKAAVKRALDLAPRPAPRASRRSGGARARRASR